MKETKSSKPKKQRLYHYKKEMHKKQQSLRAHADKKLRQQLKTRSIAVRKGDTVKVMRGTKKGTTGKITEVNYKKGTIYIDKVTRKKANGEEIPMAIQASKVLVQEIDRTDQKRFKRKKTKQEKETEKKKE